MLIAWKELTLLCGLDLLLGFGALTMILARLEGCRAEVRNEVSRSSNKKGKSESESRSWHYGLSITASDMFIRVQSGVTGM